MTIGGSTPISRDTLTTTQAENIEYIEDAIDALGKAKPATTTDAATGATKETGKLETADGAKTVAELEKLIADLEREKAVNLKKMDKIEKQIEELADEAAKEIAEAAATAKKIGKEQEAEANEAMRKSLAQYIDANKAEPGSMSHSDLSKLIESNLPSHDAELAKCLAQFTKANEKIGEIDSLLGSLNLLIIDTTSIDKDLADANTQLTSAKEAEAAAKAAQSSKSCDPIGFIAKDASGVEARYDFIIDDGNFDSTSDFLGAENQWAEMEDLDGAADGTKDGTISVDEMEKKNIKMVKTVVNPDGTKTQTVVDPRKEFGDDFSVDLNSYRSGGTHDAISTDDADKDGVLDQQLLGTFNVNFGDGKESIKGYNTLDDVDYLTENYGIENDIVDDTSLKSKVGEEGAENYKDHINFFEVYSAKSAQLKTDLQVGLAELGIVKIEEGTVLHEAKDVGKRKAELEDAKIEEEVKKEVEAEEEAKAAEEEAKAAEEEKTAAEEETKPEEGVVDETTVPETGIEDPDDLLKELEDQE